MAAIFMLSTTSFAQKGKNKKKLSEEETKEVVSQLGFGPNTFLNMFAPKACSCIDSANTVEKDEKKRMEAFSGCIDEQVGPYQLSQQLLGSLGGSEKEKVINVSYDKNSDLYKSYYFKLERWLLDSCATLKRVMASNDKEREKSFSNNPEAMSAYNSGVELLRKEKYADCIPFFEKAVTIDPEFAFAWDNLAICYRKTNNFTKAEEAYKASLKVDPVGKTALLNLAVIYQLQKRDDDAINAYKEILKHYPKDPEVYYGIGLVYFNIKKDWENALENMCKAYNIYIEQKSPYRSDAEHVIKLIFAEMKKENKEDTFHKILKDNNIRSN